MKAIHDSENKCHHCEAEFRDTTFLINHMKVSHSVHISPPNKKNLSANKIGIEDKYKEEDPEKMKKYTEKLNKMRESLKVENAFRKGMIETLSKLCNESNAATEIGSLQEFKDSARRTNILPASTASPLIVSPGKKPVMLQ